MIAMDARNKSTSDDPVAVYLRDAVARAVREAEDALARGAATRAEIATQDSQANKISDEVEFVESDDDDSGATKNEDDDEKELAGDDEKSKSAGAEKEKSDRGGPPEKMIKRVRPEDLPASDEVTVDMVAKALGVIRAGRSVKDGDVKKELNHYFSDLSGPERLALLAFLTGIGQIVAAGVTGEDAPDPADPPMKLKITGEKPPAHHGEKKPPAPRQKSAGGKEDVEPPIRVGESKSGSRARALV